MTSNNRDYGCQFFKMIGGALMYNWGFPVQWHTLKTHLPPFFRIFATLFLKKGKRYKNTSPHRISEVNGILKVLVGQTLGCHGNPKAKSIQKYTNCIQIDTHDRDERTQSSFLPSMDGCAGETDHLCRLLSPLETK